MIWLFTRKKDEIRVETWYEKTTSEFIADIAFPDGKGESRRFVNDGVFQTWLLSWGRQLAIEGWKESGPFLVSPNESVVAPRDAVPPREEASPRQPKAKGAVDTHRTYTHGARAFEIKLSQIDVKSIAVWTVERVTEVSRSSRRVAIPGMQGVSSSSPDVTFARACDCIDKWLLGDRAS